ncbi:hypothetical protein BD309DRAFT_389828 [Dichomitus squalens]|nr:hypothetical protein BD309DRAFT_389828 [Dichomitus squalens]
MSPLARPEFPPHTPLTFGHSPAYSPDADFGPAPPVNKAAHLLRRTIPTLRPAPSEACHPQRLITAIILLCPERRRRLIAAATVAIPTIVQSEFRLHGNATASELIQ